MVIGVPILSDYVNHISISSFEGFSFMFFFFHGFDMWGFFTFKRDSLLFLLLLYVQRSSCAIEYIRSGER